MSRPLHELANQETIRHREQQRRLRPPGGAALPARASSGGDEEEEEEEPTTTPPPSSQCPLLWPVCLLNSGQTRSLIRADTRLSICDQSARHEHVTAVMAADRREDKGEALLASVSC